MRALRCRCGYVVPVRPPLPTMPSASAPVPAARDLLQRAPAPDGIRARIAELCTRDGPRDPRSWAHRLVERAQRGERVNLPFLRHALAMVNNDDRTAKREAGQDDEEIGA